MSAPEPQSPCISVCVLDEQGICQGCFRSADEVTDWSCMTACSERGGKYADCKPRCRLR